MNGKLIFFALLASALIAITSAAHATTLVRDVTLVSPVNWSKPVLIVIPEEYVVPYTGIYMSTDPGCQGVLQTWYGNFGGNVYIVFDPGTTLVANQSYTFYLCFGDIIHPPDLLFTYQEQVVLNATCTGSTEHDSGSTGWNSIPATYTVVDFGQTVWVDNITIEFMVSPNRRADVTVTILDSNNNILFQRTYSSTTWVDDTVTLYNFATSAVYIEYSLSRGNGYADAYYDVYYGVPGSCQDSRSFNGTRNSLWYVIVNDVSESGKLVSSYSLEASSGGVTATLSNGRINGADCSLPVGILFSPLGWGFVCSLSTGGSTGELVTSNLSLVLRAQGYESTTTASVKVDMVEVLSNESLVISGAHVPYTGGGGGGSGGGGGGGGAFNGTVIVNVQGGAADTGRVLAMVSAVGLSSLGLFLGVWAMLRDRLEYALMAVVLSFWSGFLMNYAQLPKIGYALVALGIGITAVSLIDRVIDYITS